MLPGVGVFGTGLTARVIVPLLKAEGFAVKALWGRTAEEAEELAKEMSVPFHTSRIDEVLLHHDVDLVCINLPPPLTRQVAVKTLGEPLAALPFPVGDPFLGRSIYLFLSLIWRKGSGCRSCRRLRVGCLRPPCTRRPPRLTFVPPTHLAPSFPFFYYYLFRTPWRGVCPGVELNGAAAAAHVPPRSPGPTPVPPRLLWDAPARIRPDA
uniref:Gfo/Idh/MocA-like oxidoreductase N-terminal domain-containing protein n=1 Tax=Nothoprocta perdicaria TaxID=30464 RepID=A0A8C6ZIG2_NOTPE